MCLLCGCLLHSGWLSVGVCCVDGLVHVVHVAVIAFPDKWFGASSPRKSQLQSVSF